MEATRQKTNGREVQYINQTDEILSSEPREDMPTQKTTENELASVMKEMLSEMREDREVFKEAQAARGNKSWSDKYGSAAISVAIVIIGWGLSAAFWGKDTEKQIAVSTAIIQTQLEETRRQFGEEKEENRKRLEEERRRNERDYKLMDERLRAQSIALESRGIRIPNGN